MSKALAFLKRDALIAISYRVAFAMRVGEIFLYVPLMYFIGEAVSLKTGTEATGGSYFAFLLIGAGLLGYLNTSLKTFTKSIRESQLMGTFEIVILSPTPITQMLLYSSLWIYSFQTARFLMFLALGAAFGIGLNNADALAALTVLVMAIPGFAALGVANAALVVVVKRGEIISTAVTLASLGLGGVLFPRDVLPAWAQTLGLFLPITHAVDAMKLALFQGSSIIDLLPQLGILALFAAVLLPISFGLFWMAVRWNKVSGTLAQY